MREILFRGKRKDNGEWIEGSLLNFPENTYIIPHNSEYCYDDTEKLAFDVEYFEVFPETVGQYTGLTDRNGKKIFEGDIVSFADCWDMQHKGVVYWCSGSYNVDCSKSDNEENKDIFRLFTAYACGAKIIGNIHDNPEMLGGEENELDRRRPNQI